MKRARSKAQKELKTNTEELVKEKREAVIKKGRGKEVDAPAIEKVEEPVVEQKSKSRGKKVKEVQEEAPPKKEKAQKKDKSKKIEVEQPKPVEPEVKPTGGNGMDEEDLDYLKVKTRQNLFQGTLKDIVEKEAIEVMTKHLEWQTSDDEDEDEENGSLKQLEESIIEHLKKSLGNHTDAEINILIGDHFGWAIRAGGDYAMFSAGDATLVIIAR